MAKGFERPTSFGVYEVTVNGSYCIANVKTQREADSLAHAVNGSAYAQFCCLATHFFHTESLTLSELK